jgi:hypothetical protein
VEIGDDGIPRGEWQRNNDAGEWEFDEYPIPLAAGGRLPQTGKMPPLAGLAFLWCIPLLLLLWFAFIRPGPPGRRSARTARENTETMLSGIPIKK